MLIRDEIILSEMNALRIRQLFALLLFKVRNSKKSVCPLCCTILGEG